MKYSLKTIFASAALLGGAWLFQSCNLELADPNQYTATNFWTTQTDFEGNLTALMNQWRGNYDQNVMMYAGELRTDYYYPTVSIDGSALNYDWVVRNQYSNAQTQFTNYMNIYGLISNCNTYIYYDSERGNVLDANTRNYLLGMIYGMRAWAFFQIHKMYGTGPLRIEADVIKGNYDPTSLYMTQAPVEEFLNQIKSDISSSLSYFSKGSTNIPSRFNTAPHGYYYWTKAATEMLAGEVYLWSGKVSTGNHVANPQDVKTAQQYFQNVANNYGYSLAPTYNDVINGNKQSNQEVIFATYYDVNETTSNWFNYIMYDYITGASPNQYWSPVEKDGTTPSTTAQRWSYYTNPATGVKDRNDFYFTKITGQQRYCVRNAYWYQFDENDQRRLTLLPLYELSAEQRAANNEFGIDSPLATQFIENFNADEYYLGSCFVWKYHGSVGLDGTRFVGTNNMLYYRLASTYLYLAECANYEGDNASFVNYMNLVRERAYGDSWDANLYGVKAGSFAENETAILQERAKEFFQEGDRWWSLRRMTTVKGGTDRDHMVFQPQGCMGYGLEEQLAAHPMWGEVKTYTQDFNPVVTDTPLLNYDTQKHIVLWPLDANLLGSDPKLLQTPGYSYPSDIDREQPWIEH